MRGVLAVILAAGLMVTGEGKGKEKENLTQHKGIRVLKVKAEARVGISAAIEGLDRIQSLYIKFSDVNHLTKIH